MKKTYIQPTTEEIFLPELMQITHNSVNVDGKAPGDQFDFGGNGSADDDVDAKGNPWNTWDDIDWD
ncbi:MAG: hypothetical protein IJ196_00915 [Prevotella sp.]|nr:hypothetical protein [Prevotella sp.]